MEDKVTIKEKAVVATLKASVVGIRSGWILTGLGLVGIGMVLVSTQVGYVAVAASGKTVSS